MQAGKLNRLHWADDVKKAFGKYAQVSTPNTRDCVAPLVFRSG
jgi:hypothetical protein